MTELSVEQAQEVDVKQMTKTERKELRRIISRRFRVLRAQLSQRQIELEHALAEQVRAEGEANVAKIEAKMKPLIERQNKLADAYSKVYEEAKSLGVRIWIDSCNRVKLEDRARDPVRVETHKEVQQRMAAIKEEAGWGKLNLTELEWKLDEQLAVGELESGTAQDFLEALPTIDSLLPLPKGISLPVLEPGEF